MTAADVRNRCAKNGNKLQLENEMETFPPLPPSFLPVGTINQLGVHRIPRASSSGDLCGDSVTACSLQLVCDRLQRPLGTDFL